MSELSPQDLIALCIYRAGPSATLSTYVRGRKVYEAGQSPLPSNADDAYACDI